MSVREYVGARYVPLFAEPSEWSIDNEYEPLTIVIHEGNSYTSRQYVPQGIDIKNGKYWAITGNYNAQVESYRKEVEKVSKDLQAIYYVVDNSMTQDEINKAIADHSNILFSPGTYNLDLKNSEIEGFNYALLIGSDKNIWFDNCTIKLNKALTDYYNVIAIKDAENVVINGWCRIQGDKDEHEAVTYYHGYGVCVASSKNVHIANMVIEKCMADGMLVGNVFSNTSNFIEGHKMFSENIVIDNCDISNCGRQGISIISAKNCTVSNCRFNNIQGNPGAAIDVEPDMETQFIENVSIVNCLAENTQGYSYATYFAHDNRNCNFYNCKGEGFSFINKGKNCFVDVDECSVNLVGTKVAFSLNNKDISSYIHVNNPSVKGNKDITVSAFDQLAWYGVSEDAINCIIDNPVISGNLSYIINFRNASKRNFKNCKVRNALFEIIPPNNNNALIPNLAEKVKGCELYTDVENVLTLSGSGNLNQLYTTQIFPETAQSNYNVNMFSGGYLKGTPVKFINKHVTAKLYLVFGPGYIVYANGSDITQESGNTSFVVDNKKAVKLEYNPSYGEYGMWFITNI